LENLQREDLSPIEETEGVLRLLQSRLKLSKKEVVSLLYRMRNEVMGISRRNVSPNEESQILEAIFSSLGITPKSFVETRLPLLKLPAELLDALRSGQIAYTKAKAIASLKDEEFRSCLLDQAISQNLSLSQIKEQIQSKQSLNRHEDLNSPQKTIAHTYRRLRESKLWQNPQKWKKAQTLLQKLEALLEEDSD
jgi:ParB family chromosome partitioning protein